jgi:GT2 family glycosyltransferase
MITIIYSTHKDVEYNTKFKEHLLRTVGLDDVQILEYQNNNEYSLAQVYNKGLEASDYDIVVCCHNDIKLEDGWGKKLLNDFNTNPDFAIIGKAGSCYFPESGIYWERMGFTMVGQVWHHPEGVNKWLNAYSAKVPFLIPVVTIDGLFISFDKTKIKHKFDESIGRFHFYDHAFCMPNYLDGVNIGVTTSFEITHKSIGQPNAEFFSSKDKFLEKYGTHLPIDLRPEKVYVPNIKISGKYKFGKVAVIIPTKSKLDLLTQCVDSIYEHCDKYLFDIFIADTGSSEDEKNTIRERYPDLKLIEYDYYNFAKINNDVVKNHVNSKYEFILFCNNDIKLLSDVIGGMLDVYKNNPKAGTVGCRLHYGDGTVQHDGIYCALNKDNTIKFSHLNLSTYYSFKKGLNEVFGNTAAIMMIRRNVFFNMGMFNENYINCFEDVELNVKCLMNGFKNYCHSDLVAYHYESQTRNELSSKSEDMKKDYFNHLVPFVYNNIAKIKHKIIFQN